MRMLRVFALVVFALPSEGNAGAQPGATPPPLESYAGRWINRDGPLLSSLEVRLDGRTAALRVSGRCAQGDCDWGTAEADVYRVGAREAPGGALLSAVFVRDSIEHRLVLRRMNSGQLVVDVLSRFLDDASQNTSTILFFGREGGGQIRLVPAERRPLRVSGAVRVGGAIREPTRLKHVPPVYPDAAKANRSQGMIVLECTIGPDGSVVDLRPLRGEHQILIDAAIDAVRQWRYTATLVDGVAVPVIMTVTVNFKLS